MPRRRRGTPRGRARPARRIDRVRAIVEPLLEEKEEHEPRPGEDLSRLWNGYLKSSAGALMAALLLTLLWSAQPFAFSFTRIFLVDRVLRLESGFQEFAVQYRLLWVWIGLQGAIWGTFIICHWLTHLLIVGAGKDMVYRFRKELHEKLQSLHLGYFERNPTGRIMSRVLDDVKVLQEWSTVHAISLLAQGIRLLVGLGVLFYLNWKITFLVLAGLPVYALTFYLIKPRLRRVSVAQRRLNADLYARASERISGVQVIKAFCMEKGELRAFARRVIQGLRVQLRIILYQRGLILTAGVIAALTTGLTIYLVVLQVRDAAMTLGQAMAYIGALPNLFMPVNVLTTMIPLLQSVFVVLRRVFHVLDEPLAVPPGRIKLDGMQGKIRFDDVTFTYPGQKGSAVNQVSFAVEAGRKVALMGPSGSGKSTVFMLLLRFYDPDSGVVRVGGVNLVDADPVSVRRHVCMVQQEPVIFSGTLADNIQYGRLDAGADRIVRAARQAELHDFILSLPGKYETEVGERGVTLSGGQKQRLALATALLTDPEVLLLDDTTSALDAKTEARIRATLRRVLEGRTSLIITQRVATARECDYTIVLEDGRISQQGSHAELYLQKGFYRRICEQQEGP